MSVSASGRRQIPNPHMTEVYHTHSILTVCIRTSTLWRSYRGLPITQVLFVEVGFGCDGHGQNVTVMPEYTCKSMCSLCSLLLLLQLSYPSFEAKFDESSGAWHLLLWSASAMLPLLPAQKAATRACRNAIEFNSLPAMGKLIPGGYAGMRLHIKIGTPHPVSPTSVSACCCSIVAPMNTYQGRLCSSCLSIAIFSKAACLSAKIL